MKTVFLDRDGVICRNRVDHVKSWSEFRFLPGAVAALARLTAAGCRLVVITNQAVINRGQMTCAQVEEINAQMQRAVGQAGGRIDLVQYCPHRPDEACLCRKPRPGLLLAAAERRAVDWPRAYLVGDHWTDLEAGRQVGCRLVLVLTGRGLRTFLREPEGRRGDYLVARNLAHAASYILRDDLARSQRMAQRFWQLSHDLAWRRRELARRTDGPRHPLHNIDAIRPR